MVRFRPRVKVLDGGAFAVTCQCGMDARAFPALANPRVTTLERANNLAHRHAVGHALIESLDGYAWQQARFGGIMPSWLRS